MRSLHFPRRLLLVLAALMLTALACSTSSGGDSSGDPNVAQTAAALAATQTALAEQLAEPTSTPTPEPTATIPEPPTPTEPPAFFRQEFSDVAAFDNWSYWLTSGDETELFWDIYNDRLVFELEGQDIFAYFTYDEYTYTDIRIDAIVHNLGANKNWVSFVCRETERGWYEFNIGNDGFYSIARYDDTNDVYVLLYDGGATYINTGKNTNEYTIICKGNRLTLFINGIETRSVTDDVLREGFAGISVSSYDIVPVILEFDYVIFSQP